MGCNYLAKFKCGMEIWSQRSFLVCERCHYTGIGLFKYDCRFLLSSQFQLSVILSLEQVLLFGILAIEIKRKAPNAHTVCEIVKARYGKLKEQYKHISETMD
jgi:hypothetical protein